MAEIFGQNNFKSLVEPLSGGSVFGQAATAPNASSANHAGYGQGTIFNPPDTAPTRGGGFTSNPTPWSDNLNPEKTMDNSVPVAPKDVLQPQPQLPQETPIVPSMLGTGSYDNLHKQYPGYSFTPVDHDPFSNDQQQQRQGSGLYG